LTDVYSRLSVDVMEVAMNGEGEREVRCIGCSGLATPAPTLGADCYCDHGSCSECGAPYPTAAQQEARACGQCNEAAEAWFAEMEKMNRERDKREAERMARVTVKVPVITDFWAEGARRMGGGR
jgi:hypothetical protein